MSMKYIMSWVLVMVFGVVPLVRAQAKPAAAAPAVAKPAPVAEKSAPVEDAWNNPLPPGRLTMGMHFGDQQAESSGDILMPVLSFKNSLILALLGLWGDFSLSKNGVEV